MIKKLLKYLSYLMLICSLCIFVDVDALANLNALSNLTIDENGRFYNNVNNTSSSIGFAVYTTGEGDLSYYSAFPTGSTTYTHGGAGGSIVQCNMAFVKDNYYSVSFYWLSDSAAYYYHPYYTKLGNRLAIGDNPGLSYPTFTYDTVNSDIQRQLVDGLGYLSSYTVIFRAPRDGTCLLSTFSSNPTSPSDGLAYVGYTYESLGSKPLSQQDIQNALNSQINSINTSIDNSTTQIQDSINESNNQINSNINELKEKQDEQNETSKGIWATLTDGLGSIGKWFTDLAGSIGNFFKELGEGIANGFSSLFEGIKSFFVGDEVCETVTQNYFDGYDFVNNKANRIAPDSDGWITLSLTSNGVGNVYSSKLKEDFDITKNYNVFIEVKDYSSNSRGYFSPVYQSSNQIIGDQSSRIDLDVLSINNSTWQKKGNLINFKISSHDVTTYFMQSLLINWNNGTSSITFRMLITDDLSMTVDTYNYVDKEETCTNQGGLFGMLGEFFKSIGEFFANLFSFLGDDSGPDVSGLGDTAGWLPAGPVDSLVNLPLSMFSNLSNALGSACTPVTLPLPFVHKNIELPCLNQIYSKINGLSAWITSIGFIAAAFILYTYLLGLYKWVDDTLTMRENHWNDMDQWGGI